jgi:DNA-binding SARP family transcriptional activator
MPTIRLFGAAPSVGGDDGQVVVLQGHAALLLTRLALGRGRTFSRAELSEGLWPEASAEKAAGSFNTLLWRLRRLLERPPLQHGELITCDRHGAVALSGSVPLWLDVKEFERVVGPGLARSAERLDATDVARLRAGIALYRSDILPGNTCDWVLRERERYRRNYLNARRRLLQWAMLRGQYDEGIGHAQAILERSALREDVHRDLMRLYLLQGQRAQAMRQYERCRELLRRELAIQPVRETLELGREINAAAFAGTSPWSSRRARPLYLTLSGGWLTGIA